MFICINWKLSSERLKYLAFIFIDILIKISSDGMSLKSIFQISKYILIHIYSKARFRREIICKTELELNVANFFSDNCRLLLTYKILTIKTC